MSNARQLFNVASELVQSDEFEQFRINARDFLSAREQGESAGTQLTQMTASLSEAAEILNRSFAKQENRSGKTTNVISPVVTPKDTRSYWWLLWAGGWFMLGMVGFAFAAGTGWGWAFFGPHYWAAWLFYIGFNLWRNSFVMIPDGCQALITKYGKVIKTVGAGRTVILHPRVNVSYIVNTTKEYPYNAPIRQAPTAERVDASVDLFLQFRIEDPQSFIFTLGGVRGFEEKLKNAISEVTRALIYEQKAEEIYDLVGETTQSMLAALNNQFLPAVRFVNANITHAEPSSQEYRMDLAAAEVVRVAKEAYTYQYELTLRKEQDEGDLNKELASLRETLSDIRADVAKYQAQINTAHEKEINRANAYARQLMIEAESAARANAALLEAQALDIRAVSAAYFPDVLEYRYQQNILSKLENIAHDLPQIVNIGQRQDNQVDYMDVAKQMLGIQDESLYTNEQLQDIRNRMGSIVGRIKERAAQIDELTVDGQGQAELELVMPIAQELASQSKEVNHG